MNNALLVLILLDVRRMVLAGSRTLTTVGRIDEALAMVVPTPCKVCGGLIHTAEECSLAEEPQAA